MSDLKHGRVDLGDPAVTQALLRLNAVVGVKGFFDSSSKLKSIGIQCALCHSTVDDALAPGIGRRLDGWANRDLNIGAIVALAPDLSPFADLLGVSEDTVRTVLNGWGPGKFDAALSLDGKGFRPDGKTGGHPDPSRLRPGRDQPAHLHGLGLGHALERVRGHPRDAWKGDLLRSPAQGRAPASRWRRPRDSTTSATSSDRVTSKLAALQFYQLALRAPRAPSKLFNRAAAQRGQSLFTGKAKCSTCHVPPLYSEPGYNLHTPAEINIDPFQANRSPDGGYRTTPLKGLWTHTKGGFYHDGRFATLQDVIAHYESFFGLGLSAAEKADLAEFLKSL